VNRKPAFLAAFRTCASLTEAARATKLDRSMHYAWLAEPDGKYRAAYEAAKEQAAQSLEDEAVSRATKGVFEPNVFQGRFIYPQEQYESEPAKPATRGRAAVPAVIEWRQIPGAPPLGVWKKSDGLLQFLLRGFLPAKYRQAGALEITGPQGGPIPIAKNEQLAALNDDQLADLIKLARVLAAPPGDGSGGTAPQT
jgi:hypothetical protein